MITVCFFTHFSAPRLKLPASLSLVSLGVARYSAVSSPVPMATPAAAGGREGGVACVVALR